MERRLYEAPEIISLNVNAAQIILARAMIGLPVTLMDVNKRQERAMGKLRKTLGVDDPLDEIGRSIITENMDIYGIEMKYGRYNGFFRRQLAILGLNGRKIAYGYLVKNKVFESESLTPREKLILQKYYQEGIGLKEIGLQMVREDGNEGGLSETRTDILRKKALREVYKIIKSKGQSPEPTVVPDILDGLPVGTLNILRRAGIWTIAALEAMTETEVRKTKGIGPKTLKVIKDFLASQGMNLRHN